MVQICFRTGECLVYALFNMIIKLSKRSLTILLVIFQAAVLDWYIVHYGKSLAYLSLISVDIIVVIAFIASFVHADAHFKPTNKSSYNNKKELSSKSKQERDTEKETERGGPDEGALFARFDFYDDITEEQGRRQAKLERPANVPKREQIRRKYRLGALPLAYLSWAFYSVNLSAKMLIIFLTFGDVLDVNSLFGTNMLEIAFVVTAGVFALIVTSHRDIPKSQEAERNIISSMQRQVLMDILDSVEILEFVYRKEDDAEKHTKIERAVRDAILAIVVIQLVIPTIGLYQLSTTNFAQVSTSKHWNMVQQALNLMLENIPYLIIRIYMWSQNQFTESSYIFITKNVVEIFMNDWEFITVLRRRWCPGLTRDDSPGGRRHSM